MAASSPLTGVGPPAPSSLPCTAPLLLLPLFLKIAIIENERNPSWVPLVTLFLPVVPQVPAASEAMRRPRPRRGGTPRGPAQPRPPNKKSAGPRSEGAKRTSGAPGPGPRNQEARGRHCGGAARRAKPPEGGGGGATTSVPTSIAPTTYCVN